MKYRALSNFDIGKVFLNHNNFQENLSNAFSDIKSDITFTDVTRACEDGQQLKAHKVILSFSSFLFRNLLEQNKHPNPLIYMKRIKSADMSAIIDFIYQGKTEIPQESLEYFFALAEELKIHGVIQMQTLIQLQNETAPIQEDVNFRKEEDIKISYKSGKNPNAKDEVQKKVVYCKGEEVKLENQFEIINNNKGPGEENPGKLIVDNEYKFLFHRN